MFIKRIKIIAILFLMSSFVFAKENKIDKLFSLVEMSGSTARDIKKELSSNLIGATRGDDKETLLMAALKADRSLTVITVILEAGVEVDKKTKSGKTALMYACQYSSSEDVVEKVLCFNSLTKGSRKKRILLKDKKGSDSFAYLSANKTPAKDSILKVLTEYAEQTTTKEIVVNTTEEISKPIDTTKTTEVVTDVAVKVADEIPEQSKTNENVVESVVNDTKNSVEEVTENTVDEVKTPINTTEVIPTNTIENVIAEATQTSENNNAVENVVATTTSQNEKVETQVQKDEQKNEQKDEQKTVKPYRSVYLYDFAKDGSDEGLIPLAIEIESETSRTKIENVNKKDENGRTRLMIAAKDGDVTLIKDLIYSGAMIDVSDKDGWTALMFAARYQNKPEILNILLSNNANFRKKNAFGVTALILAAVFNKDSRITSTLLENRSVTESEVRSAFVKAISAEAPIEVLQVFLNRGISLNTPYDDKTPLMYAAESNKSTEIIEWLLKNGASKTYRTLDGKSAFNFATQNSKLPHNAIYWSLSTRK